MYRPLFAIASLALFLLAAACGGAASTPTPIPSSAASPDARPADTSQPALTPHPNASSAIPPHSTDRDLVDLAVRMKGLPLSRLIAEPAKTQDYQAGQRRQFWVLDVERPSTRLISATLALVSAHAYFYVDDGLQIAQGDLERAARQFETEIYPTITSSFDRVWSISRGSNARLAIVHTRLPGLGGYFTDQDEYSTLIAPYSNEGETIYLNAEILKPGGESYKAVLAHEFQHLLHWHSDPNDESWVNEGLSEVAAELVSGTASSIPAFLRNPDVQLNDWDAPNSGVEAHYGASHLFFRYLLAHYGGFANAHALLAQPSDGEEGIDAYLIQGDFQKTFEGVFADWVVANLVDDGSGGAYDHPEAADRLEVPAGTVTRAVSNGSGQVRQFAADYLDLTQAAEGTTFTFQGNAAIPIVPTEPSSGTGMWWSGRGDGIDTSLSAYFDLTDLSKATLRFRTWYDIEDGWDYGYVIASSDEGETWQLLRGQQMSESNPVGQGYGPGYTGRSGGETPRWIDDEIDLTPYAGRKVIIRFEYVTDESTHGPGWAIDDLAIPELLFQDDMESGGNWSALDFQRVTGASPQRFLLQLIQIRDGGVFVQPITLNAANHAQIQLPSPESSLRRVVLAVAAITRGTAEPAEYSYALQPGA